METQTTMTPIPAEETASRWEDFVDIYFSPRQLFTRRANDSWWLPLIVVALLSTVIYYGFMSVNRAFMEAQVADMVAKNPQMAERMNSGAANMQAMIGGIFVPIGITIAVLLGGFLTWL